MPFSYEIMKISNAALASVLLPKCDLYWLPFKDISDYWYLVLASEGDAVSDGIRTRLKGCKCNLHGNILWNFVLSDIVLYLGL